MRGRLGIAFTTSRVCLRGIFAVFKLLCWRNPLTIVLAQLTFGYDTISQPFRRGVEARIDSLMKLTRFIHANLRHESGSYLEDHSLFDRDTVSLASQVRE